MTIDAVTVYGDTETACFACAPRTMRPKDITEAVAQKNPSPKGSWTIKQDLVFKDGERQGHTCEIDSDYRHWYLMAVKK